MIEAIKSIVHGNFSGSVGKEKQIIWISPSYKICRKQTFFFFFLVVEEDEGTGSESDSENEGPIQRRDGKYVPQINFGNVYPVFTETNFLRWRMWNTMQSSR
jgi:hypothetical protein